jgi:hypothetical protein
MSDEIARLEDTKRALEATSRTIQTAARISRSKPGPVRTREKERLDTMKQTVYEELRNVDLLLRLLKEEARAI